VASRKTWIIALGGATLLLSFAGGLVYWAHRPPARDDPRLALAGAAAGCRRFSGDERRDCYRAALTETVRKEGVAGAMAALKAVAALDDDVEREGHVYAHGIGIAAYLARPSVPENFDRCPNDFASGCGHGVIQAYLESQVAVDSATINALCVPYREPGDTRWQLFQCVHGAGHGLVMMNGGDLPRALQVCDFLATAWDRDSCYGGAFMENIMGEISPHHPATELVAGHAHHASFKRLDSSDLLYPCSVMATKYLRTCYEIQTAAILHFTKGSIGKAARACDAAPEDWRPTCYASLGRDLTSRALRDPGKTKRLCARGGQRYRHWCYFGAVKSLVDWSAGPEAGMEFCRILGQETGWLLCYRAVGEQIASLVGPAEERATLCSTAERPEAIDACRYGAQLPVSQPHKRAT
jgi:hypothetical protein